MRTIIFAVCLAAVSCNNGGGEGHAEKEDHQFQILSKGTVVDLQPHVSSDAVTVFDFYAEWCAPCKKLNKSLIDLKKVYGDKIHVYKLDIMNWDSELAKHHNIKDLPYLIVYNKGELMKKGPSNEVLPEMIRTLSAN